MTNIGLFKKDQKPQRETFNFITRVDTVDPELKKKTLERMLELKKELEAEKKRKAEARKRAARRGFAVAAIVALVIAVTPLRGYVASAAENIYQFFLSLSSELGKEADNYSTKVLQSKSDNNFTMQINEVLIDNNCVYFTLTNHYENLEDYYIFGADDKSDMTFHYFYYAEIYDDNNKVYFKFSDADRINGFTVDKSTETLFYKVIIPDLLNSFENVDQIYSCDVHAEIYLVDDNIYPSDIMGEMFNLGKLNQIQPFADMNFNFKVNNMDVFDKINSYNINHSCSNNGIEFNFKQLVISPFDTSLTIELISKNDEPYIFWNQMEIIVTDEEGNEILLDKEKLYTVDSKYVLTFTCNQTAEILSKESNYYNFKVQYIDRDDSYFEEYLDLCDEFTLYLNN